MLHSAIDYRTDTKMSKGQAVDINLYLHFADFRIEQFSKISNEISKPHISSYIHMKHIFLVIEIIIISLK